MPKVIRKGGKSKPWKATNDGKVATTQQCSGKKRGRPAKSKPTLQHLEKVELTKSSTNGLTKTKPRAFMERVEVKGLGALTLAGESSGKATPSAQKINDENFPELNGNSLIRLREFVRGTSKDLSSKLDEIKGTVSNSIATFMDCTSKIEGLNDRLLELESSFRGLEQSVQKNENSMQQIMSLLKGGLSPRALEEPRSSPKTYLKIRKVKQASAKLTAVDDPFLCNQGGLPKPAVKRGRRAASGVAAEDHPNVYSSEKKDCEGEKKKDGDRCVEEEFKTRAVSAPTFNCEEKVQAESASLMRVKVEMRTTKRLNLLGGVAGAAQTERELQDEANITFGGKDPAKDTSQKCFTLVADTEHKNEAVDGSKVESRVQGHLEPSNFEEALQKRAENAKELEFDEGKPQPKVIENGQRPSLHPGLAHSPAALFSRTSEKRDFF